MTSSSERSVVQPISAIVAKTQDEYKAGGVIPAGELYYNSDRFVAINIPEDVNLSASYSIAHFPRFVGDHVVGLNKSQVRELMYWGIKEKIVVAESEAGPNGREVRYLRVNDIFPLIDNVGAWRESKSKKNEPRVDAENSLNGDSNKTSGESNRKINQYSVAFRLAKMLNISLDDAKDYYHWAVRNGVAPVKNNFDRSGAFTSRIDEEGINKLVELYNKVGSDNSLQSEIVDGITGSKVVVFDQDNLQKNGEVSGEASLDKQSIIKNGGVKEFAGKFLGGVNLNMLGIKERLLYKNFVKSYTNESFGFVEIPNRLRVAILEKWGEQELVDLQAEYGKIGGHEIDFKSELDRITVYAIRAIAYKRDAYPSKAKFQTNPRVYNSMILDSDLQIVLKELKVMKAKEPDFAFTLDDIFVRAMGSEDNVGGF